VEVRAVKGGELARAAKEAVAAGAATVVASGGDGTVSAVASALAGTETTLAILPTGTLNHFAKDLGLPLDLPAAAAVVAAGHVRPVDVGAVNGHVFVNNASIGIYPTMVRRRDEMRERLGRGKWAAMLAAALSLLKRHPMIHLRIGAEDRCEEQRSPFVFVGNNNYEIALFSLGTRAAVDRGELCLYFARRTGRWGMIRMALRALLGTLTQDKDFEAMCLSEVSIDSHRDKLWMGIDGEVREVKPPLRFRSWPGALKVLAPAPASTTPPPVAESAQGVARPPTGPETSPDSRDEP
jgi:diacylglycerol kinase family enzyme